MTHRFLGLLRRELQLAAKLNPAVFGLNRFPEGLSR